MKANILIIVACSLASLVNAQKLKSTDVPEAVKKSFAERFAKAKEVKWSKESAAVFEAEFEVAEKEQSATFDTNGQWLGTETEIKTAELPASVKATLDKEFHGFTIKEAEKAETPGNADFFEVELKNGNVNYDVQLSADGKILKKEEIKSKK